MNTYRLKEIAESVIPKRFLRIAGLYFTRASAVANSGDKVHCPCCDKSFDHFLSYGFNPRPNALCPWCLSLERHRLLWLYLEERTNIFTDQVSLLHVAPEHMLQERLKACGNIDYLSADIEMPNAMVQMDITDIQYPDNSFDIVLCNHVLEHIRDDHKAMSELYRVMKPGGWAVLQTPVDHNAQHTIEDLETDDPKVMKAKFGQEDHVRTYGLDKKDRLEAVGFRVTVDPYVKNLAPEVVQWYGLMASEDIYFCEKLG